MTSRSVYLAGPITGTTYGECTDWREYVKRNLAPGVVGYSPMRAKAYLARLPDAISGHGREYAHLGALSLGAGVVARDRFDTTRCDVVLVNLLGASRVSIGTMIELGWADAARNPIVLAMEDDNPTHDHMMVRTLAGYIVPTLDEAIHVVNAILTPDPPAGSCGLPDPARIATDPDSPVSA